MCSELYEMVKDVAETLEMIQNGAYRCRYCGKIADDDIIICRNCGKKDQYEPYTIYDYIDDKVLSVEYRTFGKNDPITSVSLCITFGGPNIYIDTDSNDVIGYWGCDVAKYSLDDAICDKINEIFGELWNSQ